MNLARPKMRDLAWIVEQSLTVLAEGQFARFHDYIT